jgi:hypothetical protein
MSYEVCPVRRTVLTVAFWLSCLVAPAGVLLLAASRQVNLALLPPWAIYSAVLFAYTLRREPAILVLQDSDVRVLRGVRGRVLTVHAVSDLVEITWPRAGDLFFLVFRGERVPVPKTMTGAADLICRLRIANPGLIFWDRGWF